MNFNAIKYHSRIDSAIPANHVVNRLAFPQDSLTRWPGEEENTPCSPAVLLTCPALSVGGGAACWFILYCFCFCLALPSLYQTKLTHEANQRPCPSLPAPSLLPAFPLLSFARLSPKSSLGLNAMDIYFKSFHYRIACGVPTTTYVNAAYLTAAPSIFGPHKPAMAPCP